MKVHTQVSSMLALVTALTVWLSGCGGDTKPSTPAKSPTTSGGVRTDTGKHDEHAGHMEGEHKEAGHKEGGHEKGHAHEKGHGDEKGHQHAGHGSEADMKAAAEKLASYDAAMHEIDALREQIEHLIERGNLTDVHPPAQHISIIAKRLPELAKKSNIPQENWKDINTQSRDLANLFDEIDEAADAGKKPETEAALAKMVKLIDGLKAFAPKHDKDERHEEKK